MIRVINQIRPAQVGRMRLSSLAPHALPIGEMIHWSVLARWTKSVEQPGSIPEYIPPNVEGALNAMFAAEMERPTPVVGEDGHTLDWLGSEMDREFFMRILPPRYRGDAARMIQAHLAGLKSEPPTEISKSFQGPTDATPHRAIKAPELPGDPAQTGSAIGTPRG